MSLLIDSHALVWWTTLDRRLSQRVRQLLDDEEGPFLISAATAWELTLKATAGQLNLGPYQGVAQWLAQLLQDDRFQALAVNLAHATAVGTLPQLHADPFDRMLIAQATVEGVPLVTRDRMIRQYPIQTIW